MSVIGSSVSCTRDGQFTETKKARPTGIPSGCLDSDDLGIPVETKYDLTMKHDLVRTANAFTFDL